ncbi:MAG: hypothetical protein LBO74_14850 [Candidatus Symbiothrix sp.]|jgi:formiminotetrahydrofolate cyclodeaminase|nr:hypothetical protein [Candidatus Symbiothrix sp.]
MRSRIFFTALILLSIHTIVQGQVDWENAEKAFEQENYLDAVSFCQADYAEFPKARVLQRKKLTKYAEQCYELFTKKDCSALAQVKAKRNEYKPNLPAPQTDKKLEACKKAQKNSYSTDYKTLNKTISDANLRRAIRTNTNIVLSELDKAYSYNEDINLSIANVTTQAINDIKKMWDKSKFYVTDSLVGRTLLEVGTNYEIRNISVFFEKGGNSEIAIEYTQEGKVNGITEVLPQHLFELKQMIEEDSYPLDNIIHLDTIKHFIELFRSAYCNEDIDFIEKVFSDEALIIVGKEVRIWKSNPEISKKFLKIKHSYKKYTKSEYIANLRKAFDKNEYVNVKFDDLKIDRHKKDHNIYGITVRQRWYSSTYNDEGWLFLMIDFSNIKEPLIWVRTWQPLSVPEDEIFWLGNFPIR